MEIGFCSTGRMAAPIAINLPLALRSMIDEAAALGVAAPLATRVLDSYEAAARAGLGGQDASALRAWRFRQAKAKRT
jgi:3-hydroxyisobutyrate dehydrogenase-like beta-hydroxyacid dehydrogenase